MTRPAHVAVIDDRIAACTCGRWSGPARRDDEPLGKYTNRAHEAFLSHVAAGMVQAEFGFGLQLGMFEERVR